MEPLPSNDRGTHIKTNRLMGFMNCAVEMDSVAMVYIRNFINIGSGVQKIHWVWDSGTHKCRGQWDLKVYFTFSK